MVMLSDIAGSVDNIMGVKAVWSPVDRLLCFGSGKGTTPNDLAFYARARGVAKRAVEKPYVITIGGGQHVPPEYDGRVLDVVRTTPTYGATETFLGQEIFERSRLAQWPAAVVSEEVYRIDGYPHLVRDLGFPDQKVLDSAFDGVIRRDEHIDLLWKALASVPLHRDWDIQPMPGFRNPETLRRCGALYPKVRATEGKLIEKKMRMAERNPALSKFVKELNRESHGGVIVCEGCCFSDAESKLFDAHHLDPLGTGPRWSCPDSFAVLCPTCHRWAHHKAEHVLTPLSITELRTSRLSAVQKS
jgi:5-methylcytosine-specific restriction enzyme A